MPYDASKFKINLNMGEGYSLKAVVDLKSSVDLIKRQNLESLC